MMPAMKSVLPMLLTVLASIALADVPRKPPITQYSGLWNNSPFTTKPIVENGPPEDDVFEDYTLAGVSPVKGGYRVTLMKRNDPSDRTFVYSNDPQPTHSFKILSVERDSDKARSTVVHMMSGSRRGTVTYDEKLLTIAAPKPPQQNPNSKAPQMRGRPVTPVNIKSGAAAVGQAAPGQAGQATQASPRAPRPRVIGPPPAPQSAPQSDNQRPDLRNIQR